MCMDVSKCCLHLRVVFSHRHYIHTATIDIRSSLVILGYTAQKSNPLNGQILLAVQSLFGLYINT